MPDFIRKLFARKADNAAQTEANAVQQKLMARVAKVSDAAAPPAKSG